MHNNDTALYAANANAIITVLVEYSAFLIF